MYLLSDAYLANGSEPWLLPDVDTLPDITTAFAEAGLHPADVDVCLRYDAFTITPVVFLEDLGFCAKGEGGAFVAEIREAP